MATFIREINRAWRRACWLTRLAFALAVMSLAFAVAWLTDKLTVR